MFNTLVALTLDGPDLFVVSHAGGPSGDGLVTELNASTGALVRVLDAPAYQFGNPTAIVADGPNLFVASLRYGTSPDAGVVTELNASTGALVRVLSAPEDYILQPLAMTLQGGHLFIASNTDSGNGVVPITEVNATTGALMKVLWATTYDYTAMVTDGGDIFVAGQQGYGPSAVVELNASTGSLVRVMSAAADQFDAPDGLLVDRTYLFVSNSTTVSYSNGDAGASAGSLTELDASTGALVRVISGHKDDFSGPKGLALSGQAEVFVGNADSATVTELRASTGALVRVISGQP
jgi:hypothetical protein